MTKIMLVEDDKSLREIYGVRLLAEGYDIVSAGDGEEALAMAIKERPSLIVSDVMMPKISGFDMLDILRSTTETKNIRVIMMTALSSEEQRQRGETLGADRYLVKSQVGIEDVVRVVHEVLEDQPGATTAPEATSAPSPPAAPTAPAPAAVPTPAPAAASIPTTAPVAPTAAATVAPAPAPSTPPANLFPSQPPAAPAAPAPAPAPAPKAAAIPTPSVPAPTTPMAATPAQSTMKDRVIKPLNDPLTSPVNIDELLDKEIAKEAGIADDARPAVATTDQEKEIINEQLDQFASADSTPEVEIGPEGDLKLGEQADQSDKPVAPPPPPPPPAAV